MSERVKRHDYPGRLLVVEGPDGSGKSTIAKKLAELMVEASIGTTVRLLRQPADEQIRAEILTTPVHNWVRHLYLFMKDREMQWNRTLWPALRDGEVVVLDRYYHSSCAYQGGKIGVQGVLEAHGPFIVQPDITFILDAPMSELMKRMEKRGRSLDVFEEDPDYFELVRLRYQGMCAGVEGFEECLYVAGAGERAWSQEEVMGNILRQLEEKAIFDAIEINLHV